MALFLSLIAAPAATVTAMVQRVTGGWATNSIISFYPSNTPAVLSGGFAVSSSAQMRIGSNGWGSNNLVTGIYRFAVDQSTRDYGVIWVPDSTATFDLWSLITSTNIPFTTNIGAVVRSVQTNGVNVGSQTALNFIAGSNTVLSVTNSTASNRIDIQISSSGGGGGSGEVTTAQLNTTSNALFTLAGQMDTTTSNGLYSLIVGGGITAGTATNIAQFFATNSAVITSNTLWAFMSGLSNTVTVATNPVVFHPGALLVTNTMQVGSDVIGERVSAGQLGFRNSNTPQGISLYRYSTNSNADAEWGFLNWFSTEFQVGLNKSGVGQNRSLGLAISGSTRWRVGTDSSLAPTAVYKLGTSALPIGDINSVGVVNASNVVVAGGSTTRVGIGTTNPAVELDVYGAVRLENLTASRLLGINAQKDMTNLTLDASLTLAGDTLSVTVATNPVVFGPGLVVVTNGYAIGGTSSSHVYLRRNGTQFLVRLGDDSAYTSAMASYWSTHNGGGEKSSIGAGGTGNFWTGSDGRLIWSSATSLSSGTGTADVGIYRHGTGTNAFGTGTTTPAGSILASNLHLLGRLTIPANNAASNYVWTCTNSATGEGEWRVNPGAGGGEANVNGEISLTNSSVFGLVYGKAGVTNLLRSIRPGFGLLGTNESTNVTLAVDSSVIAPVTLVTATSNGAVAFTMTASNAVYGFAAGKQSGSFILSNLLAMGITNIVAGTNMYVQTNGGVLVLNNSAIGSGSQTPWASDINAAGYSLTNLNGISATGTMTAAEFKTTNASTSGTLTLQATNPTGALSLSLPATSTGSNNLIFHFSSITAGDVFKVHAVSGNNVTMTNGVDNNSGGTGSSNMATLTLTNTLRFGETNIIVSSPANILLDLSTWTLFKVALLTNAMLTFTNVPASGLQRAQVLIQQDTNGQRTVDWAVAGGLLQTNASLQPTTNANALDLLEVSSSYFATNLLAWWPQNFQARVAFTNSLASSGGGGGGGGVDFQDPTNLVGNYFMVDDRPFTNAAKADGFGVTSWTNMAPVGGPTLFSYQNNYWTNNLQGGRGGIYIGAETHGAFYREEANSVSNYFAAVVLKFDGTQTAQHKVFSCDNAFELSIDDTRVGYTVVRVQTGSDSQRRFTNAIPSRAYVMGIWRQGTNLVFMTDQGIVGTNAIAATKDSSSYYGLGTRGSSQPANKVTATMYAHIWNTNAALDLTNAQAVINFWTNRYSIHP